MAKVYLGLGSNQGDRLLNLQSAIKKLQELGSVVSCSSVYETAPKYETNQPEFLNLICCLETAHDLKSLHATTRTIEKTLGRIETYKNGPRVLDIDLLYSDSAEYKSEELQVPHPKMTERAFVLIPLKEIAADLKIHNDKSVAEILSEISCQEKEGIEFFCSSRMLTGSSEIACRDKTLNYKDRILLMGILNITPDSFSGDGLLYNKDRLSKQIDMMSEDGADILDIGGESTRPGHTQISEQQEIDRVIPVIELVKASSDITISIDTYKSKVAREALKAGAKIVNDIWGLQYDPAMAATVREFNAAIVLMHNSSKSDQVEAASYKSGIEESSDILSQIVAGFKNSVSLAHKAGIQNSQIILDPGIGFGKSLRQNLLLLKNMNRFAELGFPILSAASRKSFIGKTLNQEVENRLEGSLAAATISAMSGASIVRAHDVKETRRVLDLTFAVLKS